MSSLISVIVSVYNEENGLKQFYETTRGVLEEIAAEGRYRYELVFVNDGSRDQSGRILGELREMDPEHVAVVSFARNFGHEAAMTAGLDYARGDYLVFMDADLQHPPACIPRILKCFEEGFDVVSMVRT